MNLLYYYNMNEQELKEYIKKNLRLNIVYGIGFSKKIQLMFEDGDIISEINLGSF